MWKQANFHVDYALYRLDMVGIEMARPNYIILSNLLRYFDHSIRIPCVSMDPFSKNHAEVGKFVTSFTCQNVSIAFSTLYA
jgi:hypothetical protein